MRLPAMFVCLSVCLLARLLKNACMDLDDILRVDTRQVSGRGRTDQLLSPIRIIIRMPEPDCFLRYCMHCNARNFITSEKSHVQLLGMVIFRPSQQRPVVLRRQNTVVGGKCVLPSAVLLQICIASTSCFTTSASLDKHVISSPGSNTPNKKSK